MLEKKVRGYTQTFSESDRAVVHQWLEVFHSDSELLPILDKLHAEDLEKKRLDAEERLRRKYDDTNDLSNEDWKRAQETREAMREERTPRVIPKLPELRTVINICPHCNGEMRGEPIPGCETNRTGRIFYSECSRCAYYYEMFLKKIRNKTIYTKIEGGIENGRTENDR